MATRTTTHPLAGIVGANIVAARERKGLTQHQLATVLATSISRVSSWENGRHLPRNPQALADELFGGDVSAMYREPDEVAA